MSLVKLLKDWVVRVFDAGRRQYLSERDAAFRAKEELESHLGTLESRPLSNPTHLHQAAQELAEILDPEMMNTPLEKLVETLQDSDDPTNYELARSRGVARHYIEVIWDKIRHDARYEYKLPPKVKNPFLEHVTLSNLRDQEVFQTQFTNAEREVEYKLVRAICSNQGKRSKLRPKTDDKKRLWINPGLEWLVDETASRMRVQELIESARGLRVDLLERFVPENTVNQAFDARELTALADEIVSFQSRGYRVWNGTGDVSVRHQIKEDLRRYSDGLLADIDVVGSKDEFLELLDERKEAPPPAASVAQHVGPMHRHLMITAARANLQHWNKQYEDLVAPVREKSMSVQEGLIRMDQLWAAILHDIDAEHKIADAPRRLLAHAEHQPDNTSFDKLYHEIKTAEQERTITVSVWSAIASLNRLIKAATRPPSTLASLTHSYDWRAQVKKAIAEAELEWLHPTTEDWIDALQKAEQDAEADVSAETRRWSERLDEVVHVLRQTAKAMDVRYEAWQTTGRVHCVRDLYQAHLARMHRVPDSDRIPRDWVSAPMLDHWDPLAGPWWTEEQRALYERVRTVDTHFVSWSDMQASVLMRQTEVSAL